MTDIAGLVAIVGGSVLGLVTSFVLWRRAPAAVALILMAASGALVGTGALMVQTGVATTDWVVTLLVLAGLTPVHSRLLFGPPGGSRDSMVALADDAA